MQSGQFKFNFSDLLNNSFKRAINNGEFCTFFQLNTPEADCNITTALSRSNPIIKIVEDVKDLNCGVAIYNGKKHKNPLNIIDFASQLEFKDTNRHVVFLSGRNKTKKDLYETIDAAINYGMKNIIPVSGYFNEDEKDSRNLKNISFFDSVRALDIFNEYFKDVHKFAGTVFNPFKYTPVDLYPQYFKLMKKIKVGANYIFTQTGWDLLKLQELKWYLEKRNFFLPVIATFYFLKPDYIEKVISGKIPGVCISPDFLSTLRKEARIGIAQFMSAQWRKLQLMISGARLIGYSGVLIEGLDTVSDINVAQQKIKEAFKEFTSFEDWRFAYTEYLARAEMAPYPYRFYMYSNLFKNAYADNAKESFIKIPDCSRKERIVFSLSEKLWHKKLNSSDRTISRKMIYKCSTCTEKKCSMPDLFWNCFRQCPKKMLNGPCGDTKADGSCYATGKECIFGRIFRLASWQKKIDQLEENILQRCKGITSLCEDGGVITSHL